MKRAILIILLSIGFLANLYFLYQLTDFNAMSEWWNEENKHKVKLILWSLLVVLAYYLVKEIFGHNAHETKEAVLDVLHVNIIGIVIMPDRYLKGIVSGGGINEEKAKKIHNLYLAGLGAVSLLIMTGIVPAIDLANSGAGGGIEEGFLAILCYTVAFLLKFIVGLYWAIVLFLGWDSIKPGHKGYLRITGVNILEKEYGSGNFLTFPLLKAIELWQEAIEIFIADKIEFGSEKDDEHLHLEIEAILELADTETFLELKLDMPTVKERLKSILRSALVDAVMSTKDMTGVSLKERFQIWKALVQTSFIKELEKYDQCLPYLEAFFE